MPSKLKALISMPGETQEEKKEKKRGKKGERREKGREGLGGRREELELGLDQLYHNADGRMGVWS